MVILVNDIQVMFDVLGEFSIKYDCELADKKISEVKEILSKEDWEVLHDAIKYGRDKRKFH
mgnify:CR=1 FL=1|tara:strand:- start:209 stop:391 length:183 start_codon:yes stop_codon:yes gene_type:complete